VRRLGRGALGGALLSVFALAALLIAWPNAWYALRLAAQPRPPQLLVPVDGVRARDLADTWGAARSGGRRHQGIDIFAGRGTPVRSPVDGLVLGVGHNRLGGQVVRVLGPGAQVHYFAHLSRFGTVGEGQRIAAGTVLGYVGTSGNAAGTPPHLHYGIYNLPGGATNPYPVLARDQGAGARWGFSTTSSGRR
jgi:murein DD-endopeptidase MepM/ murein hydrolase activator NlpD